MHYMYSQAVGLNSEQIDIPLFLFLSGGVQRLMRNVVSSSYDTISEEPSGGLSISFWACAILLSPALFFQDFLGPVFLPMLLHKLWMNSASLKVGDKVNRGLTGPQGALESETDVPQLWVLFQKASVFFHMCRCGSRISTDGMDNPRWQWRKGSLQIVWAAGRPVV